MDYTAKRSHVVGVLDEVRRETDDPVFARALQRVTSIAVWVVDQNRYKPDVSAVKCCEQVMHEIDLYRAKNVHRRLRRLWRSMTPWCGPRSWSTKRSRSSSTRKPKRPRRRRCKAVGSKASMFQTMSSRSRRGLGAPWAAGPCGGS